MRFLGEASQSVLVMPPVFSAKCITQNTRLHNILGKLSCSALPAAKFFCAISKWRMASNLLPKTFRNHNNFNYDRIFRAKHQLSLVLLNRTAALPAALSNLTRPVFSQDISIPCIIVIKPLSPVQVTGIQQCLVNWCLFIK